MQHYPFPLAPHEAERARIASKRMGAAIRRGSINSPVLKEWKRRLDWYRAKSDRLSVLDFLYEYGAGIDCYCRPIVIERKAA